MTNDETWIESGQPGTHIRAAIKARMAALAMTPAFLARRAGINTALLKDFLSGRKELGHLALERAMQELGLAIAAQE